MAGKIRGMTIQINGDTKGLNKALAEVNKDSKSLQSELKQVEKALKLDPTNTELLRQKQTLLAQSVEVTRTKLDALRQAQEQMARANAANADWEKAYQPLKAKIDDTNASLKKLTAQEAEMKAQLDSGKISTAEYEAFQAELLKTTQESKDLAKEVRDLEKQFADGHISDEEYRKFQRELNNTAKELENAEKETKEFSKSIETLGGKINDVDTKLNGGITKSIERFGAAAAVTAGVAIKKYIDFGKETVKVSTLLDENVLTFDEAEKAILSWSNQTGQSAADVAGAMYDALSAGVQTADVQRFMAQATETAKAGFTNTATSVDVLTTILNAYGMEVSEVTRVSDQLLLTQEKGKTTVGDLSNGLGDLVGLAASAGVSLEDLLAAIATLTSNGMKSGSAITSLKAAISNMVKPAEQAKKQAEELGFSFDSQMLRANGLSGTLSLLNAATGGNTEQMAKLFGSTEALNAMLILSGGSNKLYTETLDGMSEAGGKTNEVISKINQKDTVGFAESVNTLANSATQLGDALSPIIILLSKVINIIASIPTPVMLAILALLGAAGAITQITKAVTALSGLGGTVGKFFGGMNIEAMKTLGIILLVVAALTALLAIIAVLIGKGGEMQQTMKGIGDSVSGIANGTPMKPPGYASGTKFHPGGLAIVGEQGAELLELPRGTRVYSHNDSKRMLGEQNSSSGDTFQITVNVESLKDVEQLMKLTRDARRMERMGKVKG